MDHWFLRGPVPAYWLQKAALLNGKDVFKIYDAVGVRITSLPATPEKILAALQHEEENVAVGTL